MANAWSSEDEFQIQKLPDRLHNRIVDWQKKYFPEYDYLVENWSKHYKQAPFRLVAKIGPLQSETIEVGKLAGKPKFQKANDLDEEMILQSAKIIKAQCSTELGSIQQHRGSLNKSQDERMQFDILRVMVEELRHAYQMLYVLASDDWTRVGKDIASETMDSLLSMETGEHVLDAFNLFFDSFVDNCAFCAIIDRVGKYQLSMQQVFSYAPMARSMGPMLYEEAFHLASGINPMRKWAAAWHTGDGNVSIANLQHHINKWVPRGLEMFGDERGGKSAIQFGFKDKLNGDAMTEYYNELKEEVVDSINYEIVKTKTTIKDRDEAVKLADKILAGGDAHKGLKPGDFVFMPSEKFYRRRGLNEFQMFDVRGEPLKDPAGYLEYLRDQLPESYVTGPDFKTYVTNLKAKLAGRAVKEEGLPFYG